MRHSRPARGVALAICCLMIVIGSVGTVNAIVPGASGSFSDPFPDRIPAGTSAAVSVQLSLAGDVGPIEVIVSLVDAGGMGTLSLDAGTTTSELTGCDDSTGVSITCGWDGMSVDSPQTLAFSIDVDADATPNDEWQLQALVDSAADGDPPQPIDDRTFAIEVPSGSTVLSGTVITNGGEPVPDACVFVLSSPKVFPAVADSEGNFTLSGLPDDYDVAVAAMSGFVGGGGPCEGVPPAPGPGDLQATIFDGVWADLGDPDFVGPSSDSYAYAMARGATSFSDSTSGITVCLTTDPADVVPRPPCVAEVPTTTSTTAPATTMPSTTTTMVPVTTTVAAPTGGALADTGPPDTVWISVVGMALMVLGGVAIHGSRRRSTA